MTATELPAGPALDLAVARACGLQAEISQTGAVHDGQCCARLRPDAPCEFSRWRLFKPSTDIADAFEALEAMRNIPGMGWTLEYLMHIRSGPQFACALHGNFHKRARGEGDTPALAICRSVVAAGKGGGT